MQDSCGTIHNWSHNVIMWLNMYSAKKRCSVDCKSYSDAYEIMNLSFGRVRLRSTAGDKSLPVEEESDNARSCQTFPPRFTPKHSRENVMGRCLMPCSVLLSKEDGGNLRNAVSVNHPSPLCFTEMILMQMLRTWKVCHLEISICRFAAMELLEYH